MLPNHPIKRNILYMCVLHQDREGRLASVPEHNGEFWWHHHCWWRHSCCQHLQDGRPQVSLRHSRMQHIDWFCSLLRCVSVNVITATWLLWIAFHLLPGVYPPAEKEMRILPSSNSSRVTQFSQQIMKTQGEWEFLRLSVNNSLLTFENRSWDTLIYTVCNTHLTPGLSQ